MKFKATTKFLTMRGEVGPVALSVEAPQFPLKTPLS